jgi:hypothetical protein
MVPLLIFNFIRILSNVPPADPRTESYRYLLEGWPPRIATTSSAGILMPVVITSSCLKRLDKSPEALRRHMEVHEEAVLGVVEELCDNISNWQAPCGAD